MEVMENKIVRPVAVSSIAWLDVWVSFRLIFRVPSPMSQELQPTTTFAAFSRSISGDLMASVTDHGVVIGHPWNARKQLH